MSSQSNAQTQRQEFLKNQGVNAKDQAIAVFTIQQIQQAVVGKIDETCIRYLKLWVPALRGRNPKTFAKWLQAHDTIFAAVQKQSEPLVGWQHLTYALYQKTPEVKKAVKISFRAQPILGTGNVKLELESKEVPFPDNVKVISTE
jgi:hypothetical protein